MIDYNAFHNYLVELVGMFQRNRSTKGMSALAQKHHCTAVTRDQFYQMKLDKLQPSQVTPQLSRVIRDTIGKSDAKAVLRESIGALNEGILANSRISQGSDRTVQITITQPMQTEVAVPPQQQTQRTEPPKPAYRVGQMAFHKGRTGWGLFLIDSVNYDSLGYHYSLVIDQTGKESLMVWPEGDIGRSEALCEKSLRPAKGNEVARFLGALTRSGYRWKADNSNGLFYVIGKEKEAKPVEVFANDLPDGCKAIHVLPALQPSPYRYALEIEGPVDMTQQYMADRRAANPATTNAILRQMKQAIGDVAHGGFDCIREYNEYTLPTLCCSDYEGGGQGMREHTVAFVKDDNNGTSYWLARDRDVLRLLAWIAYIV